MWKGNSPLCRKSRPSASRSFLIRRGIRVGCRKRPSCSSASTWTMACRNRRFPSTPRNLKSSVGKVTLLGFGTGQAQGSPGERLQTSLADFFAAIVANPVSALVHASQGRFNIMELLRPPFAGIESQILHPTATGRGTFIIRDHLDLGLCVETS